MSPPILSTPILGLFHDRYRPIRKLGGGAFGEVWQAEDTNTGRIVALKLIDKTHTTPDMAWQEATRLTSLESPHLVRVYGAALAIDVPYIDMALAPGGSTAEASDPYGVDQATAIRWAQQVAHGLQLCHTRQIVHRDIKPDNVLLSATGGALLGDFGAAAIMRSDGTTDEHGDVEIRAPEAFGGSCTAVGDVYSLGATLYYFLSGQFPHSWPDHGGDMTAFEQAVRCGAPDIRNTAPQVSRTLSAVLKRALALDPRQRYQSASEFGEALSRVGARGRHVRRVPPHHPSGRCWDASPAKGKGATVHVCVNPATGSSPSTQIAIDVQRVGSTRIRQHCQTTTAKQAPIRLRAVFDDIAG
jgi:serine/threonine protein kinase